jgi:hypothetical protein
VRLEEGLLNEVRRVDLLAEPLMESQLRDETQIAPEPLDLEGRRRILCRFSGSLRFHYEVGARPNGGRVEKPSGRRGRTRSGMPRHRSIE